MYIIYLKSSNKLSLILARAKNIKGEPKRFVPYVQSIKPLPVEMERILEEHYKNRLLKGQTVRRQAEA